MPSPVKRLRQRYSCTSCGNQSKTILRVVEGKVVPFCVCGTIKNEDQVEEMVLDIGTILPDTDPDVVAFRKDYNAYIESAEVQEKLSDGRFSRGYIDDCNDKGAKTK